MRITYRANPSTNWFSYTRGLLFRRNAPSRSLSLLTKSLLLSSPLRYTSGFVASNIIDHSTTTGTISHRDYCSSILSMVTSKTIGTGDAENSQTVKTRKRRSTVATQSNDDHAEHVAVAETEPEPTKKRRTTRTKEVATASSDEDKVDAAVCEEPPIGDIPATKTKKEKVPSHQVITVADELPKLWDKEKAAVNGSYSKFHFLN
jgi:hypothetical protein